MANRKLEIKPNKDLFVDDVLQTPFANIKTEPPQTAALYDVVKISERRNGRKNWSTIAKGEPGAVAAIRRDLYFVNTGQGWVSLEHLQTIDSWWIDEPEAA